MVNQWLIMVNNGGPGSTQLLIAVVASSVFGLNLVLLFQANSCIRMMMFNQHIQEDQDEGYLSPFRIGN